MTQPPEPAEFDVAGRGMADGCQEDWFAFEDAVYAARDRAVTTVLLYDGTPVARIVPATPGLELEPELAQYLSILAAQDIRRDRSMGLGPLAERHMAAWRALQPLCLWDDPPDAPDH